MEMSFNWKSTLSYYELDLVKCVFSTAKRKRNLVNVLGADGDLDYMQGLGEPTYESRTMQAEFRMLGNPEDIIERLNTELEGMTIPIVLPDDPRSYVIGNTHILQAALKEGGTVVITASCKPWRLRILPVIHRVPASDTRVQYTWNNSGRRTAVPEITVHDADVTIESGSTKKILTAGTYLMPELAIPGKDSISVAITGGAMTAEYREANL
ncbi:MAG: hypothetical protein ACI3VZ_08195 [Faecousia sp.]